MTKLCLQAGLLMLLLIPVSNSFAGHTAAKNSSAVMRYNAYYIKIYDPATSSDAKRLRWSAIRLTP